jgi:hypothetical protein
MSENNINRVHCNKCKDYKYLHKPWYIVKKKGKYGDLISIRGVCPDCHSSQSRKLSQVLIKMEAREIFKAYPYGEYKLDEEGNITNKDGGILPLLPLLGVIFGGITAASGVAGATAGAVLAKQKKMKKKKEPIN